MYNRYQGNSGRVQRVQDSFDRKPAQSRETAPQQRSAPARQNVQRNSGASGCARPAQKKRAGLMEQLQSFIPRTLGELETEDIIIILILYLMYRDSGDTELLIIMGAMFLM